MSYPKEFQGIAVADPDDWLHPKKISFAPKSFDDHDVDIKIIACGVCGSDTHCAGSHWGRVMKNQVVGHEVIGTIVKLGPKCNSGLKVGDRVGVGAQALSCMKCEICLSGNENYCLDPLRVGTYRGVYKDGYKSQGGYANYIRVNEHFAIPIPDAIPSNYAAPLLCGGVTAYSPLVRNGCGPGKKVGIVGIGGIGHMGVIFAKALGAEVYAFSRGENKREDALKLGADHYYATGKKGWETELRAKLDLIVICASSLSKINIDEYISITKPGGDIQSICVPPRGEILTLQPFGLYGIKIGNSAIGSPQEIKEMLDLVAKKNLKIWIETLPIGEAGVHEAWDRMEKGDVRYRFVLTDYEKEFST